MTNRNAERKRRVLDPLTTRGRKPFGGVAGTLSRKTLVLMGVLFVAAVSVRIGLLASLWHDPLFRVPILDERFYLDWAERIVSGSAVPASAYFVEPGYAVLIALFLALFHSAIPVSVFQILLGSIVPLFLFLAVRNVVRNEGISFFVGLTAAGFGPFIFYDVLLLKTSVEMFLLSAIVLSIVMFWQRGSWRFFLALGMLFGLTAIVKANILFTIPFLFASIIFSFLPRFGKETLFKAGAFLFGATLLIAPITIRNWSLDRSLSLINTSGGPNLYIGNWEGADGTLKPPAFISVDPQKEESSWRAVAESYNNRHLSGSEVSSFWMNEAVSSALGDIPRIASLGIKKIRLLFARETIGDNFDIAYGETVFRPLRFAVPFWVAAMAGMFGVLFSLFVFEKRFLPLYALLFGYSLTMLASHVAERYRLALAPVLLLFFGIALSWGIRQWRARRYGFVFSFLFALSIFSLLAFVPIQASRTTRSDMNSNFGAVYEKRGEFLSAEEFFERGLAADDAHIPSLLGLGRMELRSGNIDRSIELFRKALSRDETLPAKDLLRALDVKEGRLTLEAARAKLAEDSMREMKSSVDADFIEGMKLLDRGSDAEKGEAVRRLTLVTIRYPDEAIPFANLGMAQKKDQQVDAAESSMKQALDLEPSLLSVRLNLANLYAQKKDFLRSIAEYREINRVVPGYYLSRLYLADTYRGLGDAGKAEEEYRRFIDEAKVDPRKTSFVKQAEQSLAALRGKP